MSADQQSPDCAPEESMAALLVRVGRSQDIDAFETLFRYFAPRIKAYMARGGKGGNVAEELMQETMMAVWRKARLYDPARGAASTWIFTIARNQRIDALRRDGRAEFDPNDPALVPEAEPRADRTVEAAQEAQMIRAALDTLPGDQAEVLRLSYYEDLSQSAIAEKLKVPLGTVKSRMRLAFIKLKSAVGAGGGAP